MPRRHTTPPHVPYAPLAGCNKTRYRSEAAARSAAELQELTQPRLELHVYKCPLCAGWHLTRKASPSD